MQRDDLDKGRQICSEPELLAGERHREIDADGGEQLQPHGVLAGAIKGLETQAVFEPAEEQLDLPALAMELRNHGRRAAPQVGPEGQAPAVLPIVEADATHVPRPVTGHIGAIEADGLVGTLLNPDRPRPSTELTPRQREILQLLAEGRSMKEAGAMLNLTRRTIAFHKYRMMQQLNVKTTAELIQYAVKNHIV